MRRGRTLVELTSPDLGRARAEYLSASARLTLAEAAEVLGISARTADRLWAYARAWLHQALEGSE